MKKKKYRLEKIALVIVGIFLVFLVFYLTQPATETPEEGIEAKIIAKFDLNEEETEVKKLTDLEELKEKYPVIYEEAKEGYY